MGMKLQSSWTCDICDRTEAVDIDTAPLDWRYLIQATPQVDAHDHSVDVTMSDLHRNRKLACNECMKTYREFLGEPEPAQAEVVPDLPNLVSDLVTDPTPVGVAAESTGVSGEEVKQDDD